MQLLIGLLALTFMVTTVPNSTDYNYGVDLQYQNRHTQQYDHGGDYDYLDVAFIFYTHLDYNSNNSYVYNYEGVQIYAYLYDNSGDLIYQNNESWYLEVPIPLNDQSAFLITSGFETDDIDELKFTFDFQYNSVVETYGLSLGSYIDYYTDVIYRPDVNIIWNPVLSYDIPNIINSNSRDIGINEGYEQGFLDGKSAGRQIGYSEGLADGLQTDDTALTIFEGICTVGLLPVNFFLAILNFDVLGINISGFVSALLTVSIAIILFRTITGKKQDD